VSGGDAPVELVFLWHHHQPDYRSARDRRAMLPWVRLHATKDYLDMALRLERHPAIHATFNFVPSLLDQIEDAAGGGPDALFDLLRRPVATLSVEERERIADRCVPAPRHAYERWPEYRRLSEKLRVVRARASDGELLAVEVYFLLAWLDPMFHSAAEPALALAAAPRFTEAHRDALLKCHDRLLGEVIPAYRKRAEAGQVELTESPYYHPILPLLVDTRSARRARPDLVLPFEPLAVPEDAAHHLESALARHARAFGTRPQGIWPPEGSVSPEVVELAARAGVKWLATDEGVLWHSLPVDGRRREVLYRPWKLATPAGEMVLFFRDHELSDRIGFVYHHWRTEEAVSDFIERVRRIGRDHRSAGPPVVSVILDGENCWEYYPEDGGPFLEQLYTALEGASDIRTRTPSEVIAEGRSLPTLPQLHTGSWINSDFRIWIGHPEKNRAWDLLARARRALTEHGIGPNQAAEAWESLYAAEGSDWFWWFGDDHYTADKAVFDQLFRSHLQSAYERAGITAPGWLQVPIARSRAPHEERSQPVGFIRPTLDGKRTGFYEWDAAGHYRLGAGGGSMHRDAGIGSDLYFGFDTERFYVRLDFAAEEPAGASFDLVLEFLTPEPLRVRVTGLDVGERPVLWEAPNAAGQPVPGARCQIGRLLELALPFASLGLKAGDQVELLGMLFREGAPAETIPADDLVRFSVPDASFEAAMWSA
jgi:alpha-amylase/alpha-mannosidase (GH57 family)